MNQLKNEFTLIEEKVIPSNIDLEGELLGKIMLDSTIMHVVMPVIQNAEHFYYQPHKFIWERMVYLHQIMESTEAKDIVLALRKTEQLEKCGGAHYIIQLSNNASTQNNAKELALILKEYYLKRKLIEITATANGLLYNEDSDAIDQMAEVSNQIEKLTTEILKIQEQQFADVVLERSAELKEAATNHTYKTGTPIYLDSFDRITNGLQPSDLVIIAAVTSMGKTAFAVDCARKQAKNNIPVGIFSLEMSTKQLADRMLAQEAEIDLTTLRKGGMNHFAWQRFDESTNKLAEYPLYVSDKGGLTIAEITAKAKLWKLKYGIKILYVDYLGLISDGGEKKNRSREQEVSYISSRLKTLAKDLNIPIVALSQLSRKPADRTDKRPVLSDLRDSGSIEQDADLVIFLFREDYYSDQVSEGNCEIDIAKNRNGKTGTIKAKFRKEFQRYEDENYIPQNFKPVTTDEIKNDVPF